MMDRRQFVKSGAAVAVALAAGRAGAESLRENLVDRARKVFELNLVESDKGAFHIPSATKYPRFFAWDAGWNIIGQSAFDPAGAVRELEAVFAYQREDGMVPHEAVVPELAPRDELLGDAYFDAEGRSQIIDPPSYLVGAEVLYQKTKDRRVLALLPQMQKCLDYLTGPRDLFGDGLVSIVHCWESGTDNAPFYDKPMGLRAWDQFAIIKAGLGVIKQIRKNAARGWDLTKIGAADFFVMEELCLNGLTAAGARSLSVLHDAAGDAAKAEAARGVAANMAAAMENFLWDEPRGFFYPRWSVGRREPQLRTCASAFALLLTGMVEKRKADRMFDEYLLNPKRFNTRHVTPFNSEDELRREFNPLLKSLLWRGACVWVNMSWMAARAAARYGRGMGAKDVTWPAIIIDMIDEHGV